MARGRIAGITIELDADTSKVTKQLSSFEQSTNKVSGKLRDLNKLLKLNPKNTELLTQKQKALKEQIEKTEEQLAAEKKALEQLENAGDADKTVDKQEALKRQIEETTQKLKAAEQAYKDFGSVGAQQLANLGKELQKHGEKLEAVGKTLTQKVTLPLAALGGASLKIGMEFDKSMSQVAATMGMSADEMGETGGEFEQLRNFAQEMGATTAFSATEAADALNYMALAGYDAETSMRMLPQVLNLAAAGNMDLATASDMLTDTQTALGLSMEDTERLVDQMARTSSTTNTSVEQLGDAMLTIGGTAKVLGGGLYVAADGTTKMYDGTQELNMVLGVLADNGIKGSEAGTALRNIILSLSAPTDKAAQQIAELGVEVYDSEGNMNSMTQILEDLNVAMADMTDEEKTQAIATIFNKRDIKSVNALLATNSDRWVEIADSLTNAEGAAQTMADTQLNNLAGSVTLLKSALEGAAIAISDRLAPYIRKLAEWITDLVTKFNNLDPKTKDLIVKLGLIAAAIGPVLFGVGKFEKGLGKLMEKFPQLVGKSKLLTAVFKGGMLTPILAVVAAIGVLVAAFVTLWNNNEEFRNKITEIWNGIKETFNSFFEQASPKIEALKEAFSGFIEKVEPIWTAFTEMLAPVFVTAFETISNVFSGVTTAILNILDIFTAVFEGDWDGAWEAVKTLTQTVMDLIADIIEGVLTAIGQFLGSILEAAKKLVSDAWDAIKTKVSTKIEEIKTAVQEKWEAIKQKIADKLEDIKADIKQKWEDAKKTVTDTIENIKKSVEDKWEAIKTAIGNKIEDIKEKLTKPFKDAKETIDGIVETIKGWFPINISNILSNIKLPHFSLSGSLNPTKWATEGFPKINVDWYSKAMRNGMILDHPTIFGSMDGSLLGGGDAGREAIIGVNSLQSMIRSAANNGLSPAQIYAAVREGASQAQITVYMDGRNVTAGVNRVNAIAATTRARVAGAY